MSTLGISYTRADDSQTWNIVLDQFTDNDLPRTYQASASFNNSANGSSILTGPAYRQKYIWGVSVLVTGATAQEIDALFRGWDTDRAAGWPAAVGIIDSTFGANVETSAVISSPPSYTRLSSDNWIVAFGLTEV